MAAERFITPCELPTPREREILTILIEECAEVQQRATKMLRFGRDESQPGQKYTNMERLSKEVGDLWVLIGMAAAVGLVDQRLVDERRERKTEKLLQYMQTVA